MVRFTVFLAKLCGWAALTIIGAFFALALLFFISEFPSRWTKTFTLPTGEVITDKIAVYSGLRGSSTINDLYFQDPSDGPAEHLGQVHEPELPLDQAKLMRMQNMPVLLAIGRHIFHHSLNKGVSSWWEITNSENEGAAKFLAASAKGETKWFPMTWGYVFDYANLDLSQLVMRREGEWPGLPTYLVYSTDTSIFAHKVGPPSSACEWNFDLEKTRAINGMSPPNPLGLMVDVSIRGQVPDHTTYIGDRKPLDPSGTVLYANTFELSSTQWSQIDFLGAAQAPGRKRRMKQDEVLFGFADIGGKTVTLCWHGDDFFGVEYRTLPLNTWFPSSGLVSGELVFYRLRWGG